MPVVDALVMFVPDGQQPNAELQDQLDQRGHSRWYPKDGGHDVKMPFQGSVPPSPSFTIEPGGWNHDHCDVCETTIDAGQLCWMTQEEQPALICDACYERLGPGGILAALRRIIKWLFP